MKKHVIIEKYHELQCPQCGCLNLHHVRTNIYGRKAGEDSESVCIAVSGLWGGDHNANLEIGDIDNPSGRRDAVGIEFYCEQCDVAPELIIVQHKGTTYVSWRGQRTGIRTRVRQIIMPREVVK
jgi:hypothetical protein